MIRFTPFRRLDPAPLAAEFARIARGVPDWPRRAARVVEHMAATLDATPLDEAIRKALRQFFEHSSAYVVGKETAGLEHDELEARWGEQRA